MEGYVQISASDRNLSDRACESHTRRATKGRRATLGHVTFRHAVADDYPKIAWMHSEIHAIHSRNAPEIFKEPSIEVFGPEAIEDYLTNKNGFIFVAVAGETVIGYLSGRIIEKKETPRKRRHQVVCLDAIYIDKIYRGNILGIGTSLVDMSRDLAKAKGIQIIVFDVWEFNRVAVKFCEQLGFRAKDIVMYDFL